MRYLPITLLLINIAIYTSASAEKPYEVEWIRQIGTSFNDYSNSVTTDEMGNIYITGATYGNLGGPLLGGTDIYVSKFDRQGNNLWTRQFGTTEDDWGCAMTSDSNGNIYISGVTHGIMDGTNANYNTDAFLSKIDGSGNVLWSRQIGTYPDDSSQGVALDAEGNIYIGGRTYGSFEGPSIGPPDFFLVKYNKDGERLWTRQIGTSEGEMCWAVASDHAGGVYMGGFTGGILGDRSFGKLDAVLIKYDSMGNPLWTRQMGTRYADIIYSIAADSSGNVYVCGTTEGSLAGPYAGGKDVFVAKYDGIGNLLWSRQYGTWMNDYGYSITTDTAGNIFVTGSTLGNLAKPNAGYGYEDIFLSKFDSDGNHLWSQQIGNYYRDYLCCNRFLWWGLYCRIYGW
jgi:hypothetical protein